MDPAEERRETKRQKEYINMLGYVADSEYGIPRRCACGGRMIDEVRGNEEYDTLPGKRFFTCKNYEAEGLHYRQPWVIGVQEEIKHLIKRVEEAEQVIKRLTKRVEEAEQEHVTIKRVEEAEQVITGVPNLNKQIEILESLTVSLVERRKWTPKEDILLISAWLNTSKDPIVSNEQKAGAFWKRIEEYFNSSPQLSGVAPREWSQCKQRWGRLNEQVCKFVGSYEAALKEQASGQNENDVMKAAHDIFLNDYQAKFSLEHAWRELRFDQKWRSHCLSRDGVKDKRKEAAGMVPDEEEVWPPGVKACKAAKRKKHGKEAAFDQLHSMLVVKENIGKQKLLYHEYLRRPTPEDLQRLLDVGEVRGFPGMIGSIDCTLNDINVLDRSPVFDDILQGRAPKVKFKVNGHNYRPKAELFAERQESVRKDVESAFGVLQSRFAIVKNPARLWDKEKIGKIMRTSVILHNMIVENERHRYTV
uniref:Myb-like domain-containing protein n=1 Tax=Brassica oleracea var. oleracea TaxID=109376 RepID=A0A0D3DL26_BRAOL